MKNLLAFCTGRGEEITRLLQGWAIILLTLAFVALYATVLFGGFKDLLDDRLISHLEPIIFVLIGYSFGRLPARPNEQSLKEEIRRQIRRADASQHVKEQSQQQREVLEEKLRNIRTMLAPSATFASSARGNFSTDSPGHHGGAAFDDALRQAVIAALRILDS